jgi:hypothetical protein
MRRISPFNRESVCRVPSHIIGSGWVIGWKITFGLVA